MTAKPLLIIIGDSDAPSCEDGVCAVEQNGSPAAVDANRMIRRFNPLW